MRHVLVDPRQRGLQALQLQRRDLVAAGGLDGLQVAGGGRFDGHAQGLSGAAGINLPNGR